MSNSIKIFFVFSLIFAVFAVSASKTNAQTIVDKTVATIGDGVGDPELITYSDLLWALAMQPNISINPPSSEDLNRALQLTINQRLFALEAERIPRTAPTQEETDAEIKDVLAQFSSTADFESRLRLVGFSSVKDENFQRIMEQRVAIKKYLDFRFRSFVVITPEDETKYYRETYVPEFRRRNPGLLMPTLDEKRKEINSFLTEEKVEAEIDRFLDFAKRRNEVIILSAV